MECVLQVSSLKVHYSKGDQTVRAVDGIDFSISQGETVALVGESGCGKTTTAFSLMRLLPYNATVKGTVLLQGVDVLKLADKELRKVRAEKMSIIFQTPITYLNPLMKVGHQITEALSRARKGLSKTDLKKMALETMSRVEIQSPSETFECYPHQLSGGMKQRIVIAMALITDPVLLIADEPTTNLDVTVQAQVLSLMKKLIAGTKNSCLLITHDLGIVADLCDRIYVMYASKIIEQGNTFSIFDNPLHPYTKALLKCTLSIDEYKDKIETIGGEVPDLVNPPKGCLFHPRCDLALPACRERYPTRTEVEPDHTVYCWQYSESDKHRKG